MNPSIEAFPPSLSQGEAPRGKLKGYMTFQLCQGGGGGLGPDVPAVTPLTADPSVQPATPNFAFRRPARPRFHRRSDMRTAYCLCIPLVVARFKLGLRCCCWACEERKPSPMLVRGCPCSGVASRCVPLHPTTARPYPRTPLYTRCHLNFKTKRW